MKHVLTGRQTKIPKDQRVYFVFSITRKKTGEKYFAFTEQSPHQRTIRELVNVSKNPNYGTKAYPATPMCDAIKLDGAEGFTIDITNQGVVKKEALTIKKANIVLGKTDKPGIGFNYSYARLEKAKKKAEEKIKSKKAN